MHLLKPLRMKQFLFFCASIIFLSACGLSGEYQTITVEGRYSLDLPTELTSTTELHEEASLQYMNIIREFYVMVIDEPIEDFAKAVSENQLEGVIELNEDGYSALVVPAIKDGLSNLEDETPVKTKINGLPALIHKFSGHINDIDVYYNFCVVKGNKNYYQILIWTMKNQKEKFSGDMEKIMMSFKEL